MFKIRHNEPDYAFLADKSSREFNCYEKPIETVPADSALRGQSLNINGDEAVGDNPNRYKQHGFFFNADNCIACHACETACSEKNDVPAHLAFRSVGFVEGGTYPAYQRINISLACNHCDNPVCLKGCPTRAYTKFAEYGAVLQDPDICFGCGYCTWVCPYNAPQLDPEKGRVSKCNMCVDRLEVGLKPACVSACLGKALDFGVIENIPEGQAQAKTTIPGFPDPQITHPNIRFQQTKATQREMTRCDATALKYHRDDTQDQFVPQLDEKLGNRRESNWRKLLLSHESSHSLFTLSTQAVMGAFLILILSNWLSLAPLNGLMQSAVNLPLFVVMIVLISFGLFKLNMHLGKPHRFYRGFNNLRHSPVSREIAGVSGFFAGLIGVGCLQMLDSLWPGQAWVSNLSNGLSGVTLLSGTLGLYYMIRLYLIPARPYWNHWQTATAFSGALLSLGGLLIALVSLMAGFAPAGLIKSLAELIGFGLIIEALGHFFHGRHLKAEDNEGAASHYMQRTKFGYPWLIRNSLLGINIVVAIIISQTGLNGTTGALSGTLLTLSILSSAIIGRALFYAIVIPTTLPGGFFWRNQGFVEHARETGLADMPQLGVAYEQHHKFDWRALLKTAREQI